MPKTGCQTQPGLPPPRHSPSPSPPIVTPADEPFPKIFRAVPMTAVKMGRMPDAYRQLLDAAINHLQELQAQGARSVSVSPETMAALDAKPRRPLPQKAAAPPAPLQPRSIPGPAPAAP